MGILKTIRAKIGEQVALRSALSSFRRTFWPTPAFLLKRVNYAVSRALYRNDDAQSSLGSGFSKPIIDLQTESAASGDAVMDEFLNDTMHKYWAPRLIDIWRNTCRDSLTVVRIRKVSGDNVLATPDEVRSCYLEIVPPEHCEIFYARDDQTMIERAVIYHEIESLDEESDRAQRRRGGSISQSKLYNVKRETIIEEISPTQFRYYNETAGKWIDDWAQDNDWGFVPLVEIHNEYDETIKGGYSDLESVYPFMKAFHEVLYQTLLAHKYHSIPKTIMQVNDVEPFMLNNFPNSFEIDSNGDPIPGTFTGEVSWKGTEIFFMKPEEGADFLEMTSVIGDSRSLLEFLFFCICVASETPAEAFMWPGSNVKSGEKDFLTFIRKIWRKRVSYQPYVQRMLKMLLVINRMAPETVQLSWDEIDPDTVAIRAQALNLESAALEIAAERHWVADETAARRLARHIPEMGPVDQEMTKAKDNFVIEPVLNAAPNSPGRNGNTGSKSVTGRKTGGNNE
jgi:hypothetical protein